MDRTLKRDHSLKSSTLLWCCLFFHFTKFVILENTKKIIPMMGLTIKNPMITYWCFISWTQHHHGNLNVALKTMQKIITHESGRKSKSLHTPHSKMAAILVFFCFHANWPLWPRFQTSNSIEYLTLNDAIRVNLLGGHFGIRCMIEHKQKHRERIIQIEMLWEKCTSKVHGG